MITDKLFDYARRVAEVSHSFFSRINPEKQKTASVGSVAECVERELVHAFTKDLPWAFTVGLDLTGEPQFPGYTPLASTRRR